MKYKLLLSIIALFVIVLTKAQTSVNSEAKVEDSQLTYDIVAGVSYEKAIARTTTFQALAAISPSILFRYQKSTFNNQTVHEESEFGYCIRPAVGVKIRHYYNLDKRLREGKRISNNSGNYIEGVVNVFGPAIAKSDNVQAADLSAVVGAAWGIQRAYGKRFVMNISIGPGVGFSKNKVKFSPVGGIGLGFRIGK